MPPKRTKSIPANLKRQFRETARDILHIAKTKRQFGEAVDTAGSLARAMQHAYRLGYEHAMAPPPDPLLASTSAHADNDDTVIPWAHLPPRTRSTFWSICLAALGREGRTQTPSFLEPDVSPRGTLAWRLVVPDRRTYDKRVGDGTIVTLCRLGLLEKAPNTQTVVLTNKGINTWNRFNELGGHWPDDLVETL